MNAGLFYFLTDVLCGVFSVCPLVNKAKQESLPTSRSRSHNRSQVSCTGTLTYICSRDYSHIFPWTEKKQLINLSFIGFFLRSRVSSLRTTPVLCSIGAMCWFICCVLNRSESFCHWNAHSNRFLKKRPLYSESSKKVLFHLKLVCYERTRIISKQNKLQLSETHSH